MAAVSPDEDRDRDLARRLASQEASALSDLYSNYATLVFSLACRICHDRALAEEATQNVFVQAWREAATFDSSRGTLRGWLLMMARARSLDRLRAERSFAGRLAPLEGINEQLSSSVPSPEAQVVADERRRGVGSVMAVLPQQDRALLDLAFFQGMTQAEMAAHLHQPLGTVKTRMRRVLHLMRRAVGQDRGRPFTWVHRDSDAVGSPGALSGMHVLVVDDDASTLQLTTLVLRREGARVVSASSAAMARRRLDAGLPDLLVTDLEMPEEDGYAVLENVRQRPGGSGIPAVAFTAHDEAADRNRTREAGFALHVPKPVRPAALVDRLGDLFQGLSRTPSSPSVPA